MSSLAVFICSECTCIECIWLFPYLHFSACSSVQGIPYHSSKITLKLFIISICSNSGTSTVLSRSIRREFHMFLYFHYHKHSFRWIIKMFRCSHSFVYHIFSSSLRVWPVLMLLWLLLCVSACVCVLKLVQYFDAHAILHNYF